MKHFSFLDELADYLVSWSTTDDFCIDVLQPILLRYRALMLRMLKKWNTSHNVWKRRASVVVFTRKVGESGKFTDEGLQLCNNLIWDQEDLVQKGVGWALKDLMRGNKEKVLTQVKAWRGQGVSSTIILYALRNVKGEERKHILQVGNHKSLRSIK